MGDSYNPCPRNLSSSSTKTAQTTHQQFTTTGPQLLETIEVILFEHLLFAPCSASWQVFAPVQAKTYFRARGWPSAVKNYFI